MRFHDNIRVLNNLVHRYSLHKFLKLPYSPLIAEADFRGHLKMSSISSSYLFDDHIKNMVIDREHSGGLKLSDLDIIGRRFNEFGKVNSTLNENIKREIMPMVTACQFWSNYACDEKINAPLIVNYIDEVSAEIREFVLQLSKYSVEMIKIQNLMTKTARAGFRSDNQEEFSQFQSELKYELDNSPFYNKGFNEKMLAMIDEYPEKIRLLNRQFERLHEIIVAQKPDTQIASMADRYSHLMNTSGTLSQTIESYQLKSGSNCIISIELADHRKIPEIIYFNDNSVSCKENGKHRSIRNHEELALVISQVEECCIQELLKNKPTIAKFFVDKHNESKFDYRHSFHKVENAVKNFIKHEDILKNNKVNYTVFADKDFEAIDDYISHIVHEHKVKAYANSIFSNKYKHLMNDEALGYFRELYDLEFPVQNLKKSIGSKIAAIKTQEDFTFAVKQLYSTLSGFNYEAKKTMVEQYGAREVAYKDDVLVVEIDNYEQSKKLGSSSWCIVRDSVYFDDYVRDDRRQFFIYDFSKKEIDNDAMIGITLDKNGINLYQHLKDDTSINYGINDFANPTHRLGQIHQEILKNAFKTESLNVNYKKILEGTPDQSVNKTMKLDPF